MRSRTDQTPTFGFLRGVVDGVVGWATAPSVGVEDGNGGSISPSMIVLKMACVVVGCLFLVVVLGKQIVGWVEV